MSDNITISNRRQAIPQAQSSCYMMYGEENGTLSAAVNSGFVFSWGNGATPDSDEGMPVLVPDGYTAEVVNLGLMIKGPASDSDARPTATVELWVNKIGRGAGCSIIVDSADYYATNQLDGQAVARSDSAIPPVSVNNGELINFRVTAVGPQIGNGCVASALIRLTR